MSKFNWRNEILDHFSNLEHAANVVSEIEDEIDKAFEDGYEQRMIDEAIERDDERYDDLSNPER